jgi:hypothetical protein
MAIPIEKKIQVVAVVRNTVACLELQNGKKLKADKWIGKVST